MIPKALLGLVRNLLTMCSTVYGAFLIGQWHWIAAILAVIPVYFIVLNLFGFLMLPLYAFTPEVRRAKEMERDLFKKSSN